MSNRDSLSVSKFWQELFRLSGTKLRMSLAYHPQSDGQTKVINTVIEQYLCAFVHHKLATWGKFLVWAEWSYNTLVHSAIGVSPFEVTSRRKPPSIPQYLTGSSPVAVVDDMLTSREAIFVSLRKKLLKVQAQIKTIADNHMRDVNFEPG